MSVNYANLLPTINIHHIIRQWISYDVPKFDVGGLVVGSDHKTAYLFMKSPGVFAGKPFVSAIYKELNCNVEWSNIVDEGDYVDASSSNKITLAEVKGPANNLLRGERTVLNTLARCSGVATVCHHSCQKLRKHYSYWKGTISGTRKTTPGSFSLVEKYGLLVGGASTHRLDLSQMTMLKDNHITSVGSITGAFNLTKKACGFSSKIEVECQSLEEALEACKAGADIIMLDNYTAEDLKKDAKSLKVDHGYKNVIIEASGNITFDTMGEYVSEYVDVISRGDLTQGYKCLDYSLKIQR